MDIVDKANEWVELELELRLRATKPTQEVAATGECLLCGEELPQGMRWCDAEHRDRWEKERKRGK